GCSGQAVGGRVDPHHGDDPQVFGTAEDLEHEVGPDVAGTDDGDTGPSAHRPSSFPENRTDTVPSGAMSASKTSPADTVTMGPSAPESMRSPARNGNPISTAVAASQASARSGSPRQSRPVPRDTTSPPR